MNFDISRAITMLCKLKKLAHFQSQPNSNEYHNLIKILLFVIKTLKGNEIVTLK